MTWMLEWYSRKRRVKGFRIEYRKVTFLLAAYRVRCVVRWNTFEIGALIYAEGTEANTHTMGWNTGCKVLFH